MDGHQLNKRCLETPNHDSSYISSMAGFQPLYTIKRIQTQFENKHRTRTKKRVPECYISHKSETTQTEMITYIVKIKGAVQQTKPNYRREQKA